MAPATCRRGWLAEAPNRLGIDNSPRQLETARTLQQEFGIEFPLILGNAEEVPLPDATFDFAISEYGAAIWADPYKWIPEASRLLRPGGQLMFLGNGTLFMLTVPDADAAGPATDLLLRDYFGMHRFEWPDEDGVEFHLGYGDWIRLLRANDFEVEDMIELRPAPDATTRFPYVKIDWARRWPSEEAWKARKTGLVGTGARDLRATSAGAPKAGRCSRCAAISRARSMYISVARWRLGTEAVDQAVVHGEAGRDQDRQLDIGI